MGVDGAGEEGEDVQSWVGDVDEERGERERGVGGVR